jgi:hypothetical protein
VLTSSKSSGDHADIGEAFFSELTNGTDGRDRRPATSVLREQMATFAYSV